MITPDRTSLTNVRHKNERGLPRFERETTARAGCLVDIPWKPENQPPILELKASSYRLMQTTNNDKN